MIKLLNRALAAVPKVTNASKAVRNTENNNGKSIDKKVVKATTEHTDGLTENKAKKLVAKSVSAVPKCVSGTGELGRKMTAAIPRCVNPAAMTAEERNNLIKNSTRAALISIGKAGMYWLEEIDTRNSNIRQRFQAEIEKYNEKVKRGTTGNGVLDTLARLWVPVDSSAVCDVIDLVAQYGKITVDEYPVLGVPSRWLKGASDGAAEWVNDTSTWIGNQLYKEDGSYQSGYIGGLLEPDAWEENGGGGAVNGAFIRGVLGYGALGNAKAIADMVAQPFETAEGLSTLVGHPEESLPMLWEMVQVGWTDYVEGSDEHKARVQGAVLFELADLLYGFGAAKNAVKGGKAAKQGSKAARVAGVIDKAGDGSKGIKRLQGLLDDVADSRLLAKAGKSLEGAKIPLRDALDNFRNSLRFPEEVAELAGTGVLADRYADTRRLLERITQMADDVPGTRSKVTISKAIDELDEVPVVGQIKKKLDDIAGEGRALGELVDGQGKIRVSGSKKIFTNVSGREISWVDQSIKDMDAIINSRLKSVNPGDILEGQVAVAVKETGELKATGLSLERANSTKAGDIDVLTKSHIIEVKKSLGAVTSKQLDKLTNPANPDFFNYDNRSIIYYIEDVSIKNPYNAKTLQALENAGVTVVNTLDELKGVLTQ